MLTIKQFDGQYTQAEIDAMNKTAQEAIAYFEVNSAELASKERDQIVADIHSHCAGLYDQNLGRVNAGFDGLLSEQWQRLLESRR